MIIQEEEDVNGRQGGVEMKKAEEEGRERDRRAYSLVMGGSI